MDINLNTKRFPPPINIIISYPKHQSHSVISWDKVIDKEEDKQIFYNIYRGLSKDGLFYKINNHLLNTNRFDDTVGINPNTTYWYKISSVYLIDNKEIEGNLSQPVVYQVNNLNRWFKKMNERSMWILKNTAVLFDLYKRKTEGDLCKKCYDKVRGNAGNNNCPNCFGTGFVGGYEGITQIYIRQKPIQQSIDLQNNGLVVNNLPGSWTISKIQIKNRDILINPQGQLFSVLNSHQNHANGFYFHQEMQLKELDPTDPLYKIQRVTLYPEYD